jgi:hypothetical protein
MCKTASVVNLHTFALMMEADTVSETSDFYSQLTWLVAREEFFEDVSLFPLIAKYL